VPIVHHYHPRKNAVDRHWQNIPPGAQAAPSSQNEPAQVRVRGEVADVALDKSPSMQRLSPLRSAAVKLASSSMRSITVCSRRAPIFSTDPFTLAASPSPAASSGAEKSKTS
jgi:hypothetical protein